MILLDTNILIYAYDPRDLSKLDRALSVLRALQVNKRGCVSTQVLAEFMHAAPRKVSLSLDETIERMRWFATSLRVLDLTLPIVLEAARGVREHQLAYYDAQIWASARLNQIPVLFSEDFRSGTTLEAVRFINPFAAAFDVSDWI